MTKRFMAFGSLDPSDTADATLTLRLRRGTVYRYVTVPRAIVEGFLTAPSKGASPDFTPGFRPGPLGRLGLWVTNHAKLVTGVYNTWWQCDASMVEINPLALLEELSQPLFAGRKAVAEPEEQQLIKRLLDFPRLVAGAAGGDQQVAAGPCAERVVLAGLDVVLWIAVEDLRPAAGDAGPADRPADHCPGGELQRARTKDRKSTQRAGGDFFRCDQALREYPPDHGFTHDAGADGAAPHRRAGRRCRGRWQSGGCRACPASTAGVCPPGPRMAAAPRWRD